MAKLKDKVEGLMDEKAKLMDEMNGSVTTLRARNPQPSSSSLQAFRPQVCRTDMEKLRENIDQLGFVRFLE